MFPLFYVEVLTLVFPCAYRTTVIKCPSISLSDILRHFVTVAVLQCDHQLTTYSTLHTPNSQHTPVEMFQNTPLN